MSYLTGNKSSMAPTIKHREKNVLQPGLSSTSLFFINELDKEEDELELQAALGSSGNRIHMHLKYFEIVRSVANLLSGSTTTTLAQLLLLNDTDLKSDIVQEAMKANKGYEVVVNILEVKDDKCVTAALRLIEKLACNDKIRLHLTNLGIVTSMIRMLRKPMMDARIYGVRAIAALCEFHKAARFFRKERGIKILVEFIDLSEALLFTEWDLLTPYQKDDVRLAEHSAMALKNIAKFPKNAQEIQRCGVILALRNILYTCHTGLLSEAFQLLEEMSKLKAICMAVEAEGFIAPLLAGVGTQSQAGRAACAAVLASICDKSAMARHVVRMLQGLPLLVETLRSMGKERTHDERMLISATYAVAKLAQNNRNTKSMSEKGVVKIMLMCMEMYRDNVEVFSNIMEGLAECAKLTSNRKLIGTGPNVSLIIRKLAEPDHRLLMTVAQCLGSCARDAEVAQVISEHDGMRMLFSVLQVQSAAVQATALWALRPIIRYATDSAEEIRSYTGSLGLIVRLMDSQNPFVLAQAAGVVSQVAKDMENLTILSDRGLVSALSRRVDAKDPEVQTHIAEAIAQAAVQPWNAHEFGMMGVVVAIRNYLDTDSLKVHIQAMKALAVLTKNPFNSVVLHQCDGLRAVLLDIAGPHQELQEYSMQVVNNLRMVALAAENSCLKQDDVMAYARLLQGMTTEQIPVLLKTPAKTDSKTESKADAKLDTKQKIKPAKRFERCMRKEKLDQLQRQKTIRFSRK